MVQISALAMLEWEAGGASPRCSRQPHVSAAVFHRKPADWEVEAQSELFREYDWPETQPDQPAVLAYLEHVADRFDLLRDIQLETWVTGAKYDERSQRWTIETNRGDQVSTQFLVCAVGTLASRYRSAGVGT